MGSGGSAQALRCNCFQLKHISVTAVTRDYFGAQSQFTSYAVFRNGGTMLSRGSHGAICMRRAPRQHRPPPVVQHGPTPGKHRTESSASSYG